MAPPEPQPGPAAARRDRRRAALAHVLDEAAHVLPAQGPIDTFIHHNTLHAFQHLPFHDALDRAAEMLGAQTYLSETRYEEAFAAGRIELRDVDEALARRASRRAAPPPRLPVDLAELERHALLFGIDAVAETGLAFRLHDMHELTRFDPHVSSERRARVLDRSRGALEAALREAKATGSLAPVARRVLGPTAALSDDVADRFSVETSVPFHARAIERAHDRTPERLVLPALFNAARGYADAAPLPSRLAGPGSEWYAHVPRELVASLAGEDPSELVDVQFVPIVAAFLDRGIASASMPGRERGLYQAWRALVLSGYAPLAPWLDGLVDTLRDEEAAGLDAEDAVLAALDRLELDEASWEHFVRRTLLALAGWAGMFARQEREPALAPPGVTVRLVDFLAVRLHYEEPAMLDVARRLLAYEGSPEALHAALRRRARRARSPRVRDARALALFRVAQATGSGLLDVDAWGQEGAEAILAVLDGFGARERQRTWHDAYEAWHARVVLGALAAQRERPPPRRTERPRFQSIFCIDDREEGIRRHLEELDGGHETFGTAGFFGFAIQHRGLDDVAPHALCPAVVRPAHEVDEEVIDDDRHLAERRLRRRSLWARVVATFAAASRTMLGGTVLTATTGPLAALPMGMRVLMPRTSARLLERAADKVLPAPRTELRVERHDSATEDGLAHGFTLGEEVEGLRALLLGIGLVRFARLVLVVGHGSSSVNNPHRSAYDCGACGGRRGGANARLVARIANDPEVRAGLAARGLEIPEDTVFVGALHDTASCRFTYFDRERLPASHAGDFERLVESIERARAWSAHERCRRFERAPRSITPAAALRHVEARAVDLAEARPELGHATNAVVVFGRRALTRGVFLDRRALLVSYDPTLDETGAILERTLAAAGPVCAGINLEYFFSTVDNERLGAGTKLPHNLAGLVGVMDGAVGDLRTGLPKQMIEIHEPVRLLTVIETTWEHLSAVLERRAEVRELVDNEWIRVVLVDPTSGAMSAYRGGRLEPMSVDTRDVVTVGASVDWYRGLRGHLRPVLVRPPAWETAGPVSARRGTRDKGAHRGA